MFLLFSDENVRRQSTINAQSNIELPPNYSEAILYREGSFSSKGPISSNSSTRRVSASDPISPPPSYDIVANDVEDDGGIVFRIPETVPEGDVDEENDNGSGTPLNVLNNDEGNALPDVVTMQDTSQIVENDQINESSEPLTRHDTPVWFNYLYGSICTKKCISCFNRWTSSCKAKIWPNFYESWYKA